MTTKQQTASSARKSLKVRTAVKAGGWGEIGGGSPDFDGSF